MKSEKLLFVLCVVCILVQQPGICQTVDRECSTDDGTYSGKRNVTNTGKACYPWRSDNKCFKGITDVNSTFSHNYCRNPVDPSDCHQDISWCYTDQNNGEWEFCDLPNCGSEPPANCSSPLGMGDGRISDDQIFAPSFMDQASMAKYARLNQTNANFWRASWRYPQYAYLSVNLRTPHFITKIHIQGTNYYFIKRFKILYSLDGYQWEYYTENKDDPNSAREFEGNHAGYDISVAYIKYPFIASRIAIIPVSFSNVPTLRIELFGCVSSTNIPLVTEVTTIDSNTYWGLDRSPYIINAPTTIPPGILLTIEAGVKVVFTHPTASLTIYGCLELRGIKGLEVKFLTNNILSHMGLWKNPFNNDESFWNGIFINPDSIGCKISSLKHIAIVGAGITTGLKNIEFNNLKISNSKSALKMTSINENNVIRDCVFRQNLNGIETPRAGSLRVESSQFIENEVGVSLTYLPIPNAISTNFMFVESLFRDNNYGIYLGSDCMNIKMNITVLRTNFSNHREYAISAYQYCETESFFSVVSSVFSSSPMRMSSYSRDYSLQILNSTVRDLRGKTGISIESRCKNLIISGCTFTNTSGYSLRINVDIIDSIIQINSSKFENNTGDGCIYFSGRQITSINMLTNTFLDNLVGNVVNFELPSSSNIILSKNIFKNFQSKYEISNNIIRSSNYSILASDNYWGVDDIDNISSRIFDFYRDSSKSFVEMLTYFKDERFNEIVDSQNFQLWSQNNGTVGGRLNRNITLTPPQNLTVIKSIFIPKGLWLEIIGPIKLNILAGRGILVEGGYLKAVEVTLTSRESLWNGINFISSNGSLLSNVSITKTPLALDIVNSSVKITECNIDTVKFALIRGLNYSMLDVYNSDIICSDYCIRVETSTDIIMKIASSSITSAYDSIFINQVERLYFNLTETSLKSRYNNVLNFGDGIKNGFAQIYKSKLEGFSNLASASTIFMIKESNFSSDSSCLQFAENSGSKQKNATISHSVFKCRDFAIVHRSVYYLINSSLIITANTFLGGELQISNRYPSKIIIANNYFNSVLRKDRSFLDLQLISDYDKTFRIDEVLVANNVYENVVGSGVSSVIKMSCFSEPYWSYLSAIYLRNNTFINNNVTNTILTDCISLTSDKNILNNPNSLYEMKVLGSTSNDVPQLMYFTRNFWGENVNDPNVRVYDETNDRTLMKVRVDPWYNDSTMTRMVFRSEGFIKPSGEIGGTLTQDVVLHNKESAYLVTEDITIPTGLKMTIEPGVQLNFVSVGMNIQGTLVARGNETNYITFNSRDANKRWKGLNFQIPISYSLKKLDFGWWQILHNGVWKTISLFEYSYDKATSDVLCRQAGFKESISQAKFQCNSLSSDDKAKILPCNNSSTPSVQIQCTQNNEFSLQECYITESQMTYTFYNITCRQAVTESENYVKLQSKSGKRLSFNEINNTLQLVNDLLNDEDGMFEQISPCYSGESDCFSIKPLKRPGWYLRLYKSDIVLDLAINNRNPSTFVADSSFVRISKASSEYFYIRMASQPLYLIENNNTLSTSAVEPTNTTDDAMYSFKIINLNPRSTRKIRDTGLSNGDSESSILQNVKIINADKGLFIKGVPPKLLDIEITDTSSHGVHFRGFFDGETPVILSGLSISNSGGNAINLDLVGNTRQLKVLIGECQFENCNQGCVWWNGAGSLNISKCNFRNFKKSALYANLNVGSSSSNFTIVANTFFSTIAESVVTLNNGVCRGCFLVEILGNKFINSREFNNNDYNLLDFNYINASLIENIFDNITYDVLLINRYGMSFSFENNTITNSRFREILNLYNIASFSVKNNLFMNITYKVYWSNLRTLTISNYNDDLKANITNNSFFNPESEYDVYVNTNWDTSSYKMLDLSMNKWILGDYARILSKIYCFYNDASKLPVNIWPAIYVQNNSETILKRPTSESTYFFKATGGEVTFSFTIPNATSKYIFQNSILIPANVTLSIEPGTNIEFATGRGIVAYGIMEINSVDGQFINVANTKKMDFYTNESVTISMVNAVLESDEIKFNSSKLELSNITFNVKTSVVIYSNDAGINNCSFNGVYSGLTWNKLHPDINYDYAMITITNSTFKKCERAIRMPLTMNDTRIVNSMFLDNNEAILLEYNSRPNFTIIIKDSSFINNRYAIKGSISKSGHIEISRCYYKDLQETRAQNLDATGINLDVNGANILLINENVFEENVQPAVKISKSWNGWYDKQIVILQENQFRNISKTPVTMQNMYGTDVKIYRNKFASNIVDRNINDKMSAVEYVFTYNLISYDWPLANVSVSQNSFLSNGGKHVVKIWSSFDEAKSLKAKFYKLEFSSNTFFNNFPTDSVIASGLDANFSYNIFSNPLTIYDFIALFPSQMSQNCTMNWWGSANITEIRGRIKDKYQDPSVGQVIYQPFLNKSEFSCERVNSCSGHGLCVAPDVCQCSPGWDGSSCSNYSCSKVYNCLGRGDCVGPDKCFCKNGWSGQDCSMASCDERSNCSGRGICVRPNECMCSEQFSGIYCSDCKSGRWGDNCAPCPNCKHGTCNKASGKCDCSSPNWTGELCNECAPKFFGPLCLPLVRFFSIFPTSGPDVGGTEIYVLGNNLPNVSTYICRFDGATLANGTWLSDEKVVCISPQHNAGIVTVEISISRDLGFDISKFDYIYNPVCPLSACGSLNNPKRGSCNMGKCNCFVPWTGSECDQLGITPKIDLTQKTISLLERQTFELQLNISEGTNPVQWSLLTFPSGMLMDFSGRLTWKNVPASSNPYAVMVKCSNTFGESVLKFNVSVPPSYTAILDDLSKGPYVQTRSVLISGKIIWLVDNPYIRNSQIPVILQIRSNYGTRKITLMTPPLDTKGIFYTRFQPFSSEVGLTELDAKHPAKSDEFQVQQSWTVYGLRINLNPSSIQEYVGIHRYSNFMTMSNIGVDPLSNLRILQVDAPFNIKLNSEAFSITSCSLNVLNCTIANLSPGQTISANATIEAQEPYSGYFDIVSETKENVIATSQLTFTFQQKTPIFRVSRPQVSASVSRGSINNEEVLITNIGLKAATNVKPILPNSTMISLVSFATNTSVLTNPLQPGLTLGSGETATLTFSFIPSITESLGDVEGFISVNALETRATISFKFIIVSTNQINLTVRVEDEYTYFAENKPLLADARISLTSKYGGETTTIISDSTGYATFKNITEGYYVLYTSADKHLPDSRVIFASFGENSHVTVFLQRTAVTYSWVVKPVPFEDRYDITLEADFTTNVPIPVVTMEPTQIDLDTLENGLVSAVQFKITNHGLIAAKGFQFNLPAADSHPFLQLTMNNRDIGEVPANTTLYAVMNVYVNETARTKFLQESSSRKKRSIVKCFIMLMKAVYYYICDIKRFNELMTTLDNSKVCDADGNRINGGFRPWLAPALGWGSGSDLTKGTTVVTPVNCNCAFNFPLTCFSAFNGLARLVKGFRILWNLYKTKRLFRTKFVGHVLAMEVIMDEFETITECIELFDECILKSETLQERKKRSAALSRGEMGQILAQRSIALYQYHRLAKEYVGDIEWFYLENSTSKWWTEVFEPIFSETSDGGTLVTTAEFNNLLKSPLPSNATVDMVSRLVLRYNDSFYSWEKGDFTIKEGRINFTKLQQIENKIDDYQNQANQANKESIEDWYMDAYNVYVDAEERPEEGICAKVRIQIQQRMTLTRTGFEATLILENGETSRLSNIKVEILITTFGINSSEATDKFAIGKPKLERITDVTGSGELQTGVKGQTTWLIIPFSSAAPTNDVQYNVGGTLYYSIGNENMTVPLFPDTITVKPDPKLVVSYFMEKYVYSDDPFTPTIEPAVPFVLGILISNEGYGTATSLKITSSQPEIIDNEKGLLVNFQIIGTQIKSQIISPSLTINFGDIGPHSTQSAKWILTCSLSGTFSNFSATFQNNNPLGDPRLSVLEKVEFHELLHSVMIDYPSSDLVTDFLIVDPETKLNLWPHLVYDSSNGTNPLNVSSCNASIASETSTQTRILANCTIGGWIYLRVISNAVQQISDARRNSTKRIDTENNVWIQTINKKSYLQIFDFLPNAGSYSYEIFFTKMNLYPPAFTDGVYNISIFESIARGTEVVHLKAVDQDSDNVTYLISPEISQNNLPFTLDSQTGILKTFMSLDREDIESYSLTVLARDIGSPQKTGTAFVLINVVDENDNAPHISGIEPLIAIESIAQPGFIIGIVKVTDSDKGINAETDVLLKGDADILKYNISFGELTVKIPLTNSIGNHEFSLVATDKGTPPMKTTFNFTLKVTRINQFKPKYNQTDYTFFSNETKFLGVIVGHVEAYDEDDPNELLTFEIVDTSPQLPFRIDSKTGNIVNTQAIRCSGNGTSYSFQVSVTDNGAPPTGRFSSTCRVTIHVLDVNDHSPKFTEKSFNVKIKENSVGEITLITLNVTDEDCGQNGLVESYSLTVLFPNITNPSSIFKLHDLLGGVELVLIASLDREEYSEYHLVITATDSGSPSLATSANITVSVEDENDCIPVFSQNSSNITISTNTPVNAIVYTFNASDCDENSEMRYSMESISSHESTFFNLQEASGILRLRKSLKERNFSNVLLNIKAFDGKFNSKPFQLNISISDKNTYPPEFEHKFQTFYLYETTPVGYSIATLTAVDQDGTALYYDILEGNDNGVFSIDMINGLLTLVKSLDFESRRSYKLIVIAYDDSDKSIALNGTAEILIEVLNVNEFPPEFINVSGSVYIKVEEGKLSDRIYQFFARDKDNDSISFTILKSDDSSYFMLESSTGWLSIIKPLNKSKSSQIMIQVVAKDDGIPPLESYLDVILVILSTETNPLTTFTSLSSNYPTTQTTTSTSTLRTNSAGSTTTTVTTSKNTKSSAGHNFVEIARFVFVFVSIILISLFSLF